MSYCNICTVNIIFLNYLLLLKCCRFFKLGHNTLNNLFGKVFYVFLLLEHLLCVLVVFSCLFLFITYFLCLIFLTKIISTPRIAPYIIIKSLTFWQHCALSQQSPTVLGNTQHILLPQLAPIT